MALADTGKAIGAVTDAISDRLKFSTGLQVSVGRPEPDPSVAGKRLNLFLYEAQFDGSLKNVPLDEGQRPPLWLVLKYLMTAFDDVKNSDSIQAYEYLGQGIRALQELSLFPLIPGLPAPLLKALTDNPEDLKITFDETTSELISKVMQGTDEKYRLSIGFQVRPVMIATGEPSSYSLLVGVDYVTPPLPRIIGEEGIRIPVLPSLGPRITEISPASFELGSTVKIKGTDLHLTGLSVMLGSVELPVTSQRPDELKFKVDGTIVTGAVISAASHPVAVVQTLPTGRRRSSNLLIGNLLPTLSTATTVPAAPPVTANIDLTGLLLGTNDDDVFLALYKDGETIKVFDVFTDIPPPPLVPPQTRKRLALPTGAVPAGNYLVILRVNGQQARQSPVLDLT